MHHTHMIFFCHFLCFSASLYAVASLNSDGKTLLSLLSHWNVVPTSIKLSWNASHSSPCSWAGVRCDDQASFVVSLRLSGYNISGQLGPEIGDLKHLRSINLSRNDLFGSIPSELGNCSLLEMLDFSFNSFAGELAQSIGNLQSLQFENSVSGTVPEYSSLCKLENLNSLVLSNNKLTGTIPDCFWNMSTLTELNLRYNGFHGMIPITNLSSGNILRSLRLNGNQLDGPLPSFLCNLDNLDALVLSDNKLTGVIPACFWNLSKLRALDLRRNDLNEMIPTNNVRSDNSLISLALSGNRLEGPLPPSLCKLQNLRYLMLSDNKLTGTIHDCFWSNMSSLLGLDLRENGFHGMLPTNFLNGSASWFLGLSGNQLEGPLPFTLCKLQDLMYLLLSDNKLTGTIPGCIWTMTKLYALDLRKNGFHGTIPTNIPKVLNTLWFLGLNGNQLEGPLPKSLLNCTSLGILDVGHNNLMDTFPAWLGTLPKLRALVLKQNHFHGTIGTTTSTRSFQKLRILDISYNQFNGFLPTEMIDSFQAMKKIDGLTHLVDPDEGGGYTNCEDSVDLVTKGLNLQLTRVSTIFTAIDLSGNRFEGSIPESIGELKSVKMLNFSRNQFEGVIPSTIGNMLALESLDLSWNQLGGEIPGELANLNFLEVLNLSQNRLEGRIPKGRQLSTFTISSYGGNPGLCGFPLGDCDGEVLPQPPSQSHHRRVDHELVDGGLTWESVLLGFGCGLTLGLLIGGLMFYTEKPKWFHEIVEDTCRQLKTTKKKSL